MHTDEHPFIGKYVICRCRSAGVHAGELVSFIGAQAILQNSNRLWSWKCRSGIALSGVAQYGLASDSKVDSLLPEIAVLEVIEVIPCSEISRKSIDEYNH